jgi:hypothetical protein
MPQGDSEIKHNTQSFTKGKKRVFNCSIFKVMRGVIKLTKSEKFNLISQDFEFLKDTPSHFLLGSHLSFSFNSSKILLPPGVAVHGSPSNRAFSLRKFKVLLHL